MATQVRILYLPPFFFIKEKNMGRGNAWRVHLICNEKFSGGRCPDGPPFMVRWLSDLRHSLGKRTSRESGAESLNLSLTAIFMTVNYKELDEIFQKLIETDQPDYICEGLIKSYPLQDSVMILNKKFCTDQY